MIPELRDEATGLDELNLEEPIAIEPGDIAAVRALMIRVQQLERDEDRVKRTRDAVVATYAAQLDRIERDRAYLRSVLQDYVERNGTVQLPDVGTAYLAKGDPKVEIADLDALKGELGAMFTKEAFDATAAKAYALARGLEGEAIPAGVNIVPGGPRLQIRKAG